MRTLLAVLLASALALPARAANVQVQVRDFTSGQVNNRVCTVTLVKPSGAAVSGSWVIAGDSVSLRTDQTGSCTFSNVLTLGDYRLDIAGNPGRSFPFNMTAASTNGTYNVVSLLGTNNAAPAFYDTAQVDALIAAGGGGGIPALTATNAALTVAARGGQPFNGARLNFFGDSQTADSLNTTGTPNAVGATAWTSWPNMLTNDLASTGFTAYQNYAVSGATISNLQTQVAGITRGAITWNFEWEGVNDCPGLASTNLTDWTVMKSNIWRSLLSNSGDRLVVFTLPAVGTSYAANNASTSQVARASINRWTVQEVTRLSTIYSNRVFLVDLASMFNDPTDPTFYDTLHLSDNGRRVLVSLVKRVIETGEFASYRSQNQWRSTTNTVYFPAELGTVGVGAIPQSPGNMAMEIYRPVGEALRIRADDGYLSFFTVAGVRVGYLMGYHGNTILASDAGGIILTGTNVIGNGAGITNLSVATANNIGGIKPDGSSIVVDPATGIASSLASGGTAYAGYAAQSTNYISTNAVHTLADVGAGLVTGTNAVVAGWAGQFDGNGAGITNLGIAAGARALTSGTATTNLTSVTNFYVQDIGTGKETAFKENADGTMTVSGDGDTFWSVVFHGVQGVFGDSLVGTNGIIAWWGSVFSGNGSGLTNLNATALSSGTVATARLGSGTANSSTFLRGDQTWATPAGGAAYYGPTYTNLAIWDTGGGVYFTNASGAFLLWSNGFLYSVGGTGLATATNLDVYQTLSAQTIAATNGISVQFGGQFSGSAAGLTNANGNALVDKTATNQLKTDLAVNGIQFTNGSGRPSQIGPYTGPTIDGLSFYGTNNAGAFTSFMDLTAGGLALNVGSFIAPWSGGFNGLFNGTNASGNAFLDKNATNHTALATDLAGDFLGLHATADNAANATAISGAAPWNLHVDGGNVSNAVAAATTTAQTTFTNPILAGNVTQTNGTYLFTNSTAAGKDWILLSGNYIGTSNGTYAAQGYMTPTNLSLAGASAGSQIVLGSANGNSNTVTAIDGSNSIAIAVGSRNGNNVAMLITNNGTTITTTNLGNVVNALASTNVGATYFGASAAAYVDASGYALFTNMLRPWTTKEADYTMWGTEPPMIGLRGAHKISLPGASTNVYRSWTIINLGSGTNAINQPNGTILWTNQNAAGRGQTFYCDGTNWWTTVAP